MDGIMAALINFIFYVLGGLLSFLVFAIIASAIISWLVAFDVINLRNRFVYNVARFLDALTRPVLRPFQRVIPPLGGVDLSPLVAILVIQGINRFILPALHGYLLQLVG
jgi:YggT family protein